MPINIKTGVLNYKNPTSGQYVGVDMITGDTSIVADDYSAQKTYLKDDYCIYNCKLYKAKQNIATAEAWNAAHWDETTVAAELTNAISPEVIADAVDDWLDDHPEATTTVADGSITKAKLDSNLQTKVDDVDDLKSAIDNLDNAVETLEAGSLSAVTAAEGQVPMAKGDGTWEWADPTGSGMEKVSVSGSTPSITAESNKLYICGECSTLSITPPASGICGVIFESGSTATVLTLGSGIICPDWFDDENLEADTIYELNINEGLLSVGMWGAS